MLNLSFFLSEALWHRGNACAFHAAGPGSIPGRSLQLFILLERYQPCQAGCSLRQTSQILSPSIWSYCCIEKTPTNTPPAIHLYYSVTSKVLTSVAVNWISRTRLLCLSFIFIKFFEKSKSSRLLQWIVQHSTTFKDLGAKLGVRVPLPLTDL